jgi:hypothetical protein
MDDSRARIWCVNFADIQSIWFIMASSTSATSGHETMYQTKHFVKKALFVYIIPTFCPFSFFLVCIQIVQRCYLLSVDFKSFLYYIKEKLEISYGCLQKVWGAGSRIANSSRFISRSFGAKIRITPNLYWWN